MTPPNTIRLGLDIGGTLTDVALEVGGRRVTAKTLTTSGAPEDGVLVALRSGPEPGAEMSAPKKTTPGSIEARWSPQMQPAEQPCHRPAMPAATARRRDLPLRQLRSDRLDRHVAQPEQDGLRVFAYRSASRLFTFACSRVPSLTLRRRTMREAHH